MEIFGLVFSTMGLIGLGAGVLFFIVFIFDVFIQKKYAILHNFPVIGHMRHLLTLIGPEMRQYWVANDKEEFETVKLERWL